MTCYSSFFAIIWQKMKKNTSWKFTDESSITFQSSVSGHTTWQNVLIQIKSPNNLDTWNVVWTPKTTFWHNESNETLGPFWGLMVHRQKTPPNLGRMGCACQLLSPKGPKVWFNFLCQNVVSGTHLTWQVSKSFGLLICINTCCQVVCTG